MGKVKRIETVTLNVRISPEQAAEMDMLIGDIDKYRSRSDVVRDAIGFLLTKKYRVKSARKVKSSYSSAQEAT